ncbi:hypothetical protein A2U01_0040180 [Trifolium medium]|uniref:Uncharacterized protein n=1 Tax=Trifolium medium TaxID=97028 RepID=A0A392Q700_9FABA|nr:hypothetical protein [Trifolium medium]
MYRSQSTQGLISKGKSIPQLVGRAMALSGRSAPGTDGPPFLRYGKHVGIKAIRTLSHKSLALANGMPKIKHVTTKQVTLMSIELAMMDLEMKWTLSVLVSEFGGDDCVMVPG